MRNVLHGLAVMLSLAAWGIAAAAMAVAPFEIIAIPDTQNYNDNAVPNIWTQQAQWIVTNKTTENIVFVTGEGDVTNGATTTQWDRAINGWNLLNGVVPYSVTFGNHDYTNITTSLSYVGDSTHQGGSTYGGASPDGQSFYQNISAGGLNLINLNLKYNPTDSGTVTWAQGILSANSGKPTIVTTHDYMNVDGTRSGVGNSVWSSLINNNSQIFMVLAGHNHGESRLLSTNANTGAGNKQVAQILADYQSLSNGGDGYLRKIQFDPTNSKISVSTYSPSLNASQIDADSQFAYLANFNATTNQVKLLGAYTAPLTGTISLTGLFTENFDSITATGTTAPTNWQIGPYSTGQNNNATPGSAVTNGVLTVDDGNNATLGQNFNYGTTGNSDRAIGTASTSNPGGDRGIQVGFTNQTGQTISKVRIQYTGEEWRAISSATGYTMWYSSAGFGSGFTSMGTAFTFTPPQTSGNALNGNLSANRQLIDAEYTLPLPIANGQAFYFTWHDVNDSGLSDNGIAIDDFSITPMFSLANNLVWDAVGYPAGSWNTTSTNKPWLNGSTASAFTAGDNATFSHNNGAAVAVDAGGVSAGLTTISNTAGTYTFSGGAISGPLVKSGGGTAVFQAANSFSSVAVSGGIVETRVNGALGAGGITLSGGTWKTTTNNQSYANTVTLNTATSTIWTDSNLTLTTALTSGAAAQTVIKDGPGVLQMSTDQTNLGVADNPNSFTINNGTVLLTGGTGVNYGTGKGNLIVNSGGTIAGTGRINPSGATNKVTVNLGGTIAPGLVGAGNAGTLYITSDLVLAGTYAVDLMSATSYDWLQVASDGAINLSGSTLNINLGYAPTGSPVFKILQNDSGTYGSVLGGYAEGATVSLGSYLGVPYQAKISYLGGDGNDIVLNNVAAATPTLVWNAAGYATGTWNTLSANKPWLDGATPSAFSTGSKVVFSQDGGAAVAVDSGGVSAEQMTISNASGTYTFSGGQITSKLVKSGTGSAEFNMPVNFSTATVSGGSTTFLSGAAGTVATMNVSGGAATFNAGATTSVPALNVSAGTATINNTTVGAVAVSGAGQVNLGGSVSSLTVTGGTVATTGSSAQVGTADLSSPGTGTVTAAAASPLAITSTLKLADGITASISSGNSFKASSSGNLASNAVARTLTLSGGTMSVSAPAAPTSGLVGYWKLDETGGTTAADSSPGWYASWDTNGHTTPGTAVLDPGTVTGTAPGANAVFTSAGKFGGAIQLTNTGAASSAPQGYIKLTGTAQAPNTGNIASNLGEKQFTLSAWIKQTGAGITTTSGTGGITAVPIISKGKSEGDGSTIDCNYILGIDATGKLAADYEQYGGGQNYPVTGSTTLALNTWYNVAATYDGLAWKLYVDGAQVGTATVPADPRYDSIQNAAIGSALNSTGASSGGFNGLIDDARIYNRALSPSEILSLMGGPSTGELNLSATTLALTADSILDIDGAASASFFDLVLGSGVSTSKTLRISGTNWDGVSGLASFFDVTAPNHANISQIGSGATYVDLRIVPEPSTIVLLGIGALGLLGYVWRRRRDR